MSELRSRAWCFTINHWTPEDEAGVRLLALSRPTVVYAVWGREVSQTGTPHLQGYVYFKNARTLLQVHKKLPRAHLEAANGSPHSNFVYCTKSGDYTESGEIPKPGKRTDLEEVHTLLNQGATELQIADQHFPAWVKYHKAFERYNGLRMKPRTQAPRVEWVWGETGVGKSRYAYQSSQSVYFKTGSKWWDGYMQQETIVIDDIEPKEWPLRELLTLLDRYPCQREIKGGTVHINSPRVIITCDRPPESAFCDLTPSQFAQLRRRISEVIEMKADMLSL